MLIEVDCYSLHTAVSCENILFWTQKSGFCPLSPQDSTGLEEQPLIQGVAAAQVQEGREVLLHVQGQEGWL